MDLQSGVIPYNNIVASSAVDLSLPIPISSLASRTVLITGGASGLGAAMFTSLASHGCNVIIGDLNTSSGEKLVAQMRTTTQNSNHHFIKLDVTSWQSQVSFFKQAASLSPHGGIDCVIANAGICPALEAMTFETPPDYTKMDNPPAPPLKTLQVNLDGVMFTTTLALSYLSRNPGSQKCAIAPVPGPRDRHIILVSSIAGVAPIPSQSIYCASKHGVAGLFRALRITSPITTGVRVNMISPYFVDTPILGPGGAIITAGGAMARIEDVADAVMRLVADKGIIGRALMIGCRGNEEQTKAAGLETAQEGQAIWDVFGHDLDQTDIFTRRIIGVTNIIATTRGWFGMIADVGGILLQRIRSVVGMGR